MAMISIRCPVLSADVTRVMDLEGNVVRIICAEYEEATGTCRLKKRAFEGGPLAQLLERVAEGSLNTRSTLCEMRTA